MSAGKQKTPQPFSSLSSIVSNLVRAAIGGNHQDVPDEDLDKYVADMIMKSTNNTHQSFDDNYTPDGTSGGDKARLASGVVVSRSDSNGLKTNKRFLSSIIKSTDDHNQALIRAEEKKAAEMAKELIADLDRRAEGRKRGFQGKESRRDEKSSLGRMRMDEIDRSVSPNQPRSRSRSKSPPPVVKDKNEVKVRGRGSRKYDANQAPSSSTGSRLGSKMDKYFEEGYDPLLDTHADGESGIKVKHKKRGKDRKSKESTDRSRKRHKKHKSERSSKSGRHHDPDSDDNDERETKTNFS
ncbi:hypothetical protein B0O80DRAFT_485728 [Mortierella sp. GBAus27b]|nr:hypothetical protein BGX31_001819 [Mortierella sp. GBA43]KAI8356792.1 hypothetical protein B0O80DRAFT_485728 [Mortierella sp. GBAus27b]